MIPHPYRTPSGHRKPRDSGDLASLVSQFRDTTVLVIGDIILDRYVVGDVHRLSPEAPIPVLRPARRRATLGGAANVALNIASLGGHAWLAGVLGCDEAGANVQSIIDDTPGMRSLMVTSPGRPTTVKTRFMAGAHQLLRLDEETAAPIDSATARDLLARIAGAIDSVSVVVLSDYAKGVLSDDVLREVLALTAARGCRVIADPKRADFSAYHGVSVLTPNEHEVRIATRIEAAGDEEADRAGRVALDASQAEAVLVTRSSKGLTLVRRDQEPLHLPAQAREVSDVSGAGDTLVAALAVALGAGASLPSAARLANAAAGISVGKQGTAVVTRAELLDELYPHDLITTDRKIASREDAIARVARWRAEGARIGFANGCFDLIHPGHVRLLSEARAACDRLVVALNTDASVRRLKGSSRPLQSETSRSTVMASLSPVDMVVLFDEDTPLELIRALRPDVLVKGSDYTVDTVVGAADVQSWGGEVLLVNLAEGHSTTGTIRRMTDGA